MLDRFMEWMNRRGSGRMIYRNGRRYLERAYLLRTPWLSAYLHRMWRDDDEFLHDHPWDNLSVVLRGGYYEYMSKGIVAVRLPFRPVRRKATDSHRIVLSLSGHRRWRAGETMSLFFHGREARSWGFWVEEGRWMNAEDYGRKIGEPIAPESAVELKGWFLPRIVSTGEERSR